MPQILLEANCVANEFDGQLPMGIKAFCFFKCCFGRHMALKFVKKYFSVCFKIPLIFWGKCKRNYQKISALDHCLGNRNREFLSGVFWLY